MISKRALMPKKKNNTEMWARAREQNGSGIVNIATVPKEKNIMKINEKEVFVAINFICIVFKRGIYTENEKEEGRR